MVNPVVNGPAKEIYCLLPAVHCLLSIGELTAQRLQHIIFCNDMIVAAVIFR